MQDRVSAGRDMGKQIKTTAASYWWACKSGCSQFGAEIFLLLRAKTCRRHPLQGRICCLRESYSPLPVLGPLSLGAELLGGRVFSSHTPSSQEVRFGHRARQHMSALFSVPLKTIPGGRREVKAPLLPGHSPGAVTRGSPVDLSHGTLCVVGQCPWLGRQHTGKVGAMPPCITLSSAYQWNKSTPDQLRAVI